MKIIDTHQHLWNHDQFPYSWCGPYPAMQRSFLLDDYLEAIDGVEMTQSVHVEADVDEPFLLEETRHICRLAADPGNPLAGVVAGGRPEKAGFRAYLDEITKDPHVKGIRRVLHTQPDEMSQAPLFVENIRALADYGLSFDIVMQHWQLPQALQLIRNCPEVSFILDHCGNPDVRNQELNPWISQICAIAAEPNVVCKISGIVANTDTENWTPNHLRPYVDQVIANFGWDRVMFGSDWPVCHLGNASFKRWFETALGLTSHGGEAKLQKLFHDNACRVYRLDTA